MALIVEDGTGLSTAESYLSVADCDTYHSNRGNTAWAALATTAKEQALRKATDYLVQEYRMRWKGTRMTAAQALDWPRAYVYMEAVLTGLTGTDFPELVPNDVVPVEVENATADLALKSLTLTLMGDVDPKITTEETIWPIKVEYSENQRNGGKTRYDAIDSRLRPLLQGSPGTIRMSRVA